MNAAAPALTRAAVRAADTRATTVLGLPGLCLMENAGRGLADVTIEETRRCGAMGVAVVAARGNNGGDGLVTARHLLLREIPVRVLLVSAPSAFVPTSDAGRNLAVLRALGVDPVPADDGDALRAAAEGLPDGFLLVDAVLGTGLEGPVRGHLREVLAWMARCGRPVVAADLPSGLDADTGTPLGPVPRCVATATFLAPKRGLLEGAGPTHAGRITVCDIGVPLSAVVDGGGERDAALGAGR